MAVTIPNTNKPMTEKSLDVELVQLKWQHVRSIEALQSAERENVRLKELLSETQLKGSEVNKRESAAFHTVKELVRIYKDHILRQKDDFKRLKLALNQVNYFSM